MIVAARDSGAIDKDIAELYLAGATIFEIAPKVRLASSSVGRRLGKMFRAGDLPRRTR